MVSYVVRQINLLVHPIHTIKRTALIWLTHSILTEAHSEATRCCSHKHTESSMTSLSVMRETSRLEALEMRAQQQAAAAACKETKQKQADIQKAAATFEEAVLTIRRRQASGFERLLCKHPEAVLEGHDRNGKTALMTASQSGQTAMLRRLIEARSSVDVTDRHGSTALHYACDG